MTYSAMAIILFALIFIFAGVMVLIKSAKKFNLSAEQLAKIKKRNKALEEEEKNDL